MKTPEESQGSRFDWLSQRIYGLPASRLAGREAQYDFRDLQKKVFDYDDKEKKEENGSDTKAIWKPITDNDFGGRVRCLAMTPDSRKLYAGTASGGLWSILKTDGNWGDWSAMRGFPHFSVGALAIDPTSPTTLYAGTGEPYVRLLYPGVGVLRSQDGGMNWKPTGDLPLSRISQILIHHYEGRKRIFCAGYEGLFSSVNDGSTWQPETFGNVTSVAIDSEQRLLVGIYGLGLFCRDDQQTQWQQLGVGRFIKPRFRVLIRISAGISAGSNSDAAENGARDIFYARLDMNIYSSTDGGQSWVGPVEVDLQSEDQDWASYLWAHPGLEGSLLVGGEELKRVVVSMNQGMVRSIKPPENTLVGKGSPKEKETFKDHHDATSDSEGRIYCACDGGVFFAEDFSASWRYLKGIDASQFYDLAVSPHDPEVLGGGTQDLGTWVRNAYRKWSRVLDYDGGHLVFDPFDPEIVWAQWQGNEIVRIDLARIYPPTEQPPSYSDGLVIDDPPFIGTLIADARRRNRGTLFTGRKHVFRLFWKEKLTRRDSNFWKAISPRLGGDVSALVQHPVKGNIFAGTVEGNLWWSWKDGSKAEKKHWNELTLLFGVRSVLPRRSINRLVVDPGKSNALYVCFGGQAGEYGPSGKVFHGVQVSHGRNTTWEFRDCSGSNEGVRLDTAVHSLAVHPAQHDVLFAATDSGVFRSSDMGETWERFIDDLPFVPCFDLCVSIISSERMVLRVATHGRGIFEREI